MSRRQLIAATAGALFLLALIAALFELQQRERRGRLTLAAELSELRHKQSQAEAAAAQQGRQAEERTARLRQGLALLEERLAAEQEQSRVAEEQRRAREAHEREQRLRDRRDSARRDQAIAALARDLERLEEAGAFREQSLAALRREPKEQAEQLMTLMATAVRVNARKEVGSGVVLFSGRRGAGRPLETFILTAYHVIKDDFNPTQEGPRFIEVDFFAKGRQERRALAAIVAVELPWDLALLKVNGEFLAQPARLASADESAGAGVLTPVMALGCPLGYPPMPSRGSVASTGKDFDGRPFWMITAPTIFGNSGGGVFEAGSGRLLGLLVRIAAYKNVIDVAVPHLGIVTPASAIRAWLCEQGYGELLEKPAAAAKPLVAGRKRD